MKNLNIVISVGDTEFCRANFIQFKKEAKNKSSIRLEEVSFTHELALKNNDILLVEIFYKNLSYLDFYLKISDGVNYINQNTLLLYTEAVPEMIFYEQELIDMLKQFDDGEIINWRHLKVKDKKIWLGGCLYWSGLPKQLRKKEYVIDASDIKYRVDFYCSIGEVFIGERGYFGQDPHGLNDCFIEIYNNNNTIEPDTTVIIKNHKRLEKILDGRKGKNKGYFSDIIDIFEKRKLIVKLC